jgi:hypothetical protein
LTSGVGTARNRGPPFWPDRLLDGLLGDRIFRQASLADIIDHLLWLIIGAFDRKRVSSIKPSGSVFVLARSA